MSEIPLQEQRQRHGVELKKNNDDPNDREPFSSTLATSSMNKTSSSADNVPLFIYNTRITLLLILGALPLLALTDTLSLSLLAMGLIAVYVLDYLQMRMHSLVAWWASLVLFWSSIYLLRLLPMLLVSPFNMLIMSHGTLFVLLIAIAGSLQSNWFRTWSIELATFAERFIFVALPIASTPFLMSVIMGITGAQNAPFYLALLFCVQMELFAKPTFSSFHRVNPHVRDKRHTIAMIGTERKITEGSSYIQRPLETVLLLFAAIMMPSSMYLWSHMRQIWYSFSAVHIVNVIMLVAIPLFMIGVNMRQYIWWSSADGEFLSVSRRVCIIFSVLSAAMWFSVRVIFMRYAYMIALPQPLNYIAIVFAMGIISLVIIVLILRQDAQAVEDDLMASFRNYMSKSTQFLLALGTSLFAAIASLVIGFPWFGIVLPAVTAYFGIMALFNMNSVSHYTGFSIGAALCTVMFMGGRFWFIDHEFFFDLLPFDWTLNMIHTTLILALVPALSLLLIGLVIFGSNRSDASGTGIIYCVATGMVAAVHALSLAISEQLMLQQPGENFYSPMLVFLTSAIGTSFSYRLFTARRLEVNVTALVIAIYVAKLSILLVSESLRMVLLSAICACFFVVRLYLAQVSQRQQQDSSTFWKYPLFTWLFVVCSGLFTYLTRYVLLENILQSFIPNWTVSAMSEMRVIGSGLIVWALFVLIPVQLLLLNRGKKAQKSRAPRVGGSGSGLNLLKHLTFLAMFFGVVFAVVEPSLEQMTDLASTSPIYIVLLSILLVSALSLFGILPAIKFAFGQMALITWIAVLLANAFSHYFLIEAQHYFPLIVLITLTLAFALTAIIFSNVHYPITSNQALNVLVFLALQLNALVTLVMMFLYAPEAPRADHEAMGITFFNEEILWSCRISILAVIAALNLFIALAVKFFISGRPLLRRIPAAETLTHAPGNDVQQVALVGNAATIISFLLFGVVSKFIHNPSIRLANIMSTGLVFLLSKDVLLFKFLEERVRYWIATTLIQLMLCYDLAVDTVTLLEALVVGGQKNVIVFYAPFTVILVLVALSLHIQFNRFIFKLNRVPSIAWEVIPLLVSSLLAALVSGITSVQYLGFFGLLFGMVELLVALQYEKLLT